MESSTSEGEGEDEDSQQWIRINIRGKVIRYQKNMNQRLLFVHCQYEKLLSFKFISRKLTASDSF